MRIGTSISLLCLPCGGASATMYARWRLRLPRWIQLLPVEMPGRGARAAEPFSSNFDELVEQLCLEHAHALERPYALFGHSMGGLLAYGMAIRLQQWRKRLPVMLFTSASSAPASADWRQHRRVSDAVLMNALRRYGGTPEDVFESPEMLRLAMDALAADYRLCNSFEYRGPAYLPVPLRVFAGQEDEIPPARLEGWRRETSASYSLHWFSGGHFYLRPQERTVVRLVEKELCAELRTRKEMTEAASPALPAQF
ncbi:thioesterase II family protein [Steroidobacter sp.]|uniref:thioesterase II family protein n=1 Tax=Steroidobacter sp. TaxID=1978227 RepID=UPI001A4CF0E1|nr:alpha/beta fold hydrolase [Steroidobacter sp.]MBL8271348.1 thioesterase [Steroidobacter sp.]